VHGIPLTTEGKVVLVTLSYARRWRLPGGGKKAAEDSRAAMLRELKEEIELTSYGSAERAQTRPSAWPGLALCCQGVRYQPRWSLEVKAVGEFSLQDLPSDTAQITHELLALGATHLHSRLGTPSSLSPAALQEKMPDERS
jgi:8-oxo-dGTP pyrophosphatase MutT (NUDIX family)